jgi:toxin secretion/phage lysis holin
MNKIKTVFTAFFTAIISWLGILAIPVFILVITNIIDYTTGLIASKYRNENINSDKSFRGIVKKICMWLLILVGSMLDWLLISTAVSIGIALPFTYAISIVVTIWLIANEIISILENMVDIGVSIPPFLIPLVRNIKKQVEDKAAVKEE